MKKYLSLLLLVLLVLGIGSSALAESPSVGSRRVILRPK